MSYGGGDPSTDAVFGTPVLAVSGGVDKTKPLTKSKKGISYSATANTLVLDISKSIDASTVQTSDIRALNIKNTGNIPTFIMLAYQNWTDATTQTANAYHVHYMLKPDEEIFLPSIRGIISDQDTTPYAGTAIDNGVPTAAMHLDSTANVDDATENGVINSTSLTTLYLEPYTSAANCTANLFRVGDLIRIDNEIMKVTAIGDKSDLANNFLTVERGVSGSTAATGAADGDPVSFAFFNEYHNFDKYSVPQTDASGKFKCTNLFGKGRALTGVQGIVPGSFSLQFYESGYQELGLSGITSNTNSGLTAGTSYEFDITVDGGTTFSNLTFTTDTTNVNFGGASGVISKIQAALDAQFYTAGNLFEKKVIVQIVNGDIRFTSGSHLSTSAIALGAGSTGTTEFFGTGRIPAAPGAATAVAAKLETLEVYDPVTYATSFRDELLVYDDGNGNLFGKATGTINYETGAINMTGCPPNAEFVFSVLHSSAFSGKQDATESAKKNSLQAVYANIPSQKWAGEIEIETF